MAEPTVESDTEMRSLGSGGTDGSEGLTLLLEIKDQEIFFKGHLSLAPLPGDMELSSHAKYLAAAVLEKSKEILKAPEGLCILELRIGRKNTFSLPVRAVLHEGQADLARKLLDSKESELRNPATK